MKQAAITVKPAARVRKSVIANDFKRNKGLYLFIAPVLLYYILFHYRPIYGAIIAFKDFVPVKGIWGSGWVGFKHFTDFFSGIAFGQLLTNTVRISAMSILFGFPAPIILALMLNEMRSKRFAGVVKTVTYMPHFISLVVVCAMVQSFVSANGLIGGLVNRLTGGTINLLDNAKYFTSVYVLSGIWQEVGWGSIIYFAALSAIDQELYEAADMDGCGRWRKMAFITLPGITPTIIVMLILKLGGIMSVGYEKIILLYNPLTYTTADVISSYVYRKGLLEFNYSFSTAVGLFNSGVNFIFLIIVNSLSKKISRIGIM